MCGCYDCRQEINYAQNYDNETGNWANEKNENDEIN